MAGINGTITFSTAEYRPCIVKGKKALFHKWEDIAKVHEAVMIGSVSGQIKQTVAIIEYENGTVTECYPYEIQFCDNKFNEFYFPDTEVKEAIDGTNI